MLKAVLWGYVVFRRADPLLVLDHLVFFLSPPQNVVSDTDNNIEEGKEKNPRLSGVVYSVGLSAFWIVLGACASQFLRLGFCTHLYPKARTPLMVYLTSC